MAEDTSKNTERGHDRFRWRERFEKKDQNAQNPQNNQSNSHQNSEAQNQNKNFDKNQNFNRNNNFNNHHSNNSASTQGTNEFKSSGSSGGEGNEKKGNFSHQNQNANGQNNQNAKDKAQNNVPNADEYVKKEELLNLKYKFSEVLYRYKEFEHEFENYKKRTRDEIASAKVAGMTKAIETILPALDSFNKAKAIISDQKSLNGIEMIEKSILAELEKLGVKRINCRGQKFDPTYHNAIMLVETHKVKSGYIVDEIEAGYTLGDKVIKYSQVTVSK